MKKRRPKLAKPRKRPGEGEGPFYMQSAAEIARALYAPGGGPEPRVYLVGLPKAKARPATEEGDAASGGS